MSQPPGRVRELFGRLPRPEARRLAEILRGETVGGTLLLIGAALGMIWANSPWSSGYEAVRDFAVGPEELDLHLTLSMWAGDGLLAIFFFVAGLELKREFVAGELRDPTRAALPVAAALGGVILPAGIFLSITLGLDAGAARGWAIPTATDIAFALGVLALVGRRMPTAMRTFLLTLAVVDDLIAIAIIAIFYTSTLHVLPLLTSAVPFAVFWLLVRRGVKSWSILVPLALAVWALIHASGVHATVAGVLLALTVPVAPRFTDGTAENGLAERFEHRLRPISAGIAVPLFALIAAGVTIAGPAQLSNYLSDPVAVGIAVGLVVGKSLGIITATLLVARFTRARLAQGMAWIDVVGLGLLGGIGFTVSLLIGELAFTDHRLEVARLGVLVGSVSAALAATVVIQIRRRVYRRLDEAERAKSGPTPGDPGDS